MSDLIDTTEMYLRTIFELEEEGIAPLRARIAERLEQSGPTVSQTVARMERDGLLTLADDRHLQLTNSGRAIAEQVMRRHRLAECMLVEVLKVPLADVHEEACRWEHVMSELVEQRITALLGTPTHSPFGNPIPGLASDSAEVLNLAQVAGSLTKGAEILVTIRRFAEPVQQHAEVLADLESAGITIKQSVSVSHHERGVALRGASGTSVVALPHAASVFVSLG